MTSFVKQIELRLRRPNRAALARFAPEYARAVRRVARRHAYLADLAVSFPGLLFALAVPAGSGGDDSDFVAWRDALAERIIDGLKLREAAEEAGLPIWMRGLPPEAFVAPMSPSPDGLVMRRAVGQALPGLRDRAVWPGSWLPAVRAAASACDDTYAAWVVRHWPQPCGCDEPCDGNRGWAPQSVEPVGLYAWCSRYAPGELRGVAAWNVKMEPARACGLASDWYTRLFAEILLDGELPALWHRPGRQGAFVFVPLNAFPALVEEATAMSNCALSYAHEIHCGQSQLWSVRRASDPSERVATLEVSTGWEGGALRIDQTLGRSNVEVDQEVIDAAYLWFLRKRNRGVASKPLDDLKLDEDRLSALLAAYVDAKADAGGGVFADGVSVQAIQRLRDRAWALS